MGIPNETVTEDEHNEDDGRSAKGEAAQRRKAEVAEQLEGWRTAFRLRPDQRDPAAAHSARQEAEALASARAGLTNLE